jgi:hypothetical protein
MIIIKALPVILILLLGSGCLILPIPQSSKHGEKIDKLLDQLEAGSTTREEVVSSLGKPDESWEEGILYLNMEYGGGVKIMYYSFVRTIQEDTHQTQKTLMDLLFTFDDHGMLTKYYTFDYRAGGYTSNREKIINRSIGSEEACQIECVYLGRGCLQSTYEGEDPSKQILRCLKERQACIQLCD